MAVVTISRQLGSGGDEIGQAVARELGVPYLDKELVQLMAARVGISEEMAAANDEIDRSLMTRLMAMLVLYDPEAADLEATPPPPRPVTGEAYQQVLHDMIREVAARGHAVIVGRGSQMILRRTPHVLHVHVSAPAAVRRERVARQRGIGRDEAERLILASDRQRAGYLRTEHGVDWQSPELYDLIVNTASLPYDAAVAAVVAAARAVAAAAPPVDTAYLRLRQDTYTVRDAADLLMLHPEVIRHAVYRGDLPAARSGKDIILIRRRDLLTWLGKQTAVA